MRLNVEPGLASSPYRRPCSAWRERRRWRRMLQVAGVPGVKSQQILSLLTRRSTLARQVQSAQAARRMLAVWHSIHIPIGMAAFVHIGAALYYATLQP